MKKTLFWRLFIPVACVFALCVVILAFVVPTLVERNAVAMAVDRAEKTAQQFRAIRGYYTKKVVGKVIGRDGLKASFDHENDANAIPLPATLVHDLSSVLEKEGTSFKLYSAFPFPNRASRRLDAFGNDAWETLQREPDSTFQQVMDLNGEPTVRVAVADKMVAQVCVACHNSRPDTPKNDWKLGDVRGVLEVNIPIGAALAQGREMSTTITGVMVAMFVILCLALFVIYRQTIGQHLFGIASALEDIAQGDGDLTRRLDDKRQDELGHIARWFNAFAGKLQTMMGSVGGSIESLATTAGHMSQTSGELAAGVESQRTETEQLASAMEQMVASVQEIAQHAKEAEDTVQHALTESENGRKVVDRSVRAIETLNQDVGNATDVVQQLSANSANISQVLDVIREIADQTNLLALNAAIEAARAGEQGRGFAVVADEVRQLASRTQQSTEEINVMIQKLQTGTQKMVDVMTSSRQGTDEAVVSIRQLGESLGSVAEAVGRINEMTLHISEATEQQLLASEDINRSVHSINQSCDQNVAATHQTSATSRELADTAHALQDLIGQFKF